MHARQHIAAAIDDVGKPGIVDDDGVESRHVECALSCCGHREEKRLWNRALKKWPNHANRFPAMIVRGRDTRIACTDPLGGLLHHSPRRQKHRHTTLRPGQLREKFLVEKIERLLALHFHFRRALWVKRRHLNHVGTAQVPTVKCRVDGGRQPNETTPDALAQREAQFQLGAGLMDLIDDERITRRNIAILKPSSCNARRHNDHVPCRRVGRRLTLAVHHTDTQCGGAKNRLRHGPNGERLSRPGSGDDPKASATRGQCANVGTLRSLQKRVEMQTNSKFNGFARGTRGRDDDDATGGRRGRRECGSVGRQIAIVSYAHTASYRGYTFEATVDTLRGVVSRNRSHTAANFNGNCT